MQLTCYAGAMWHRIQINYGYDPKQHVEDMLERIVAEGENLGEGPWDDVPSLVAAGTSCPELLIRLCVFLALLANDHDFLTPIVLSKDKAKYDATDDPDVRKWLEDRAARRIGRGFDVGKKLQEQKERSPHWRNPHLCLFWTGEGRKTPIIRMRSGAVVQRVSMAEVPTGYLGPEQPDEDDPKNVTAIYFIEALGQDRIKIGKADDPESRLKQLQTGSASELRLLGIIVDKATREAELHAYFADDRIQGEWFHATERMRQYIRDFAKPYKHSTGLVEPCD